MTEEACQTCDGFVNDEDMILCSICKCRNHITCCVNGVELDGAYCCAACLDRGHHESTQYQELQSKRSEESGTNPTGGASSTENTNLNIPGNSSPHIGKQKYDNISKIKLLKIQQLEELMRIEKEFLRKKYEILNLSDSEIEMPSHSAQTEVRHVSTNLIQNESLDMHTSNQDNHNSSKTINFMNNPQQNTFSILNHQSTPVGRSGNASTYNENLSYTQIAVRQSVPKELPSFGGDPREWPIFISAFEQSTRVAGYTNEENLIRLQKCLHGKARDAVRNCLMLPELVPDILKTLKMYFGRPEHILRTLIAKACDLPNTKGKLDSIIEFSFAIKNICATIKASKLNQHANNPVLLQQMVEKLGADLILKWAIFSKDIECPNLFNFSDWLFDIAEAACKITSPIILSDDTKYIKKHAILHTHVEDNDLKNTHNTKYEKFINNCIICNKKHKVYKCNNFLSLSVNERWDLVKSKGLCRQCLNPHTGTCWMKRICGQDGCTLKHSPLLHNSSTNTSTHENLTSSILNNHGNCFGDTSFFRILPVTLVGSKKSITIYAFMDDGSTLTLLDENVANSLEENGDNDPLCIRWTGNITRYEENSRKMSLRISAATPNAQLFPITNIHTVKNLGMSAETLIAEKLKTKYPYLKGIPLQSYMKVIPSLIIGINNPNLIVSLKIKEGNWNQPIATKTRLGWTIFGGSHSKIKTLNIHKCGCDVEVHELVKNYLADENMGVSMPKNIKMSNDDERAVTILNNTCKFNGDRYSTGLLWKNDTVEMPNSLPAAFRRMQCLKRKIDSDKQLYLNLQEQINNLISKGYAKILPDDAIHQKGGKIWYLPIFIVRNPHKPNKIRLVWDAAAKACGYSLNDFLFKGPDFLMPLNNILYNFRMGAVAISGDIEEMFHRVAVREEDAVAQRFLWWDNISNKWMIYQLNVLTFGASCSPCIAHFVRNKNAERFVMKAPRAVKAICQHHYVDDFIDSVQTVDEAISLAKSVREIHAKGGFFMRNWSSNSQEVLKALGCEQNNNMNKTFPCNEKPTEFEKILGMYWNPKSDTFNYILKFVRLRRNVFKESIIPTKREVLQVLMSIFDPIGFISCFLSYLKIILQDIWRSGMDWDEPINDKIYDKWKEWISFLPMITDVSIPRCYSLNIFKKCNIQIHTFVDASENAYAAVSYFRIKYFKEIEVRLVAAKAKVAPLRPLSIPRLELQSAVTGARLLKSVRDGHKDINFEKTIFWTDSKTVLNWIKADPRQFQQFVKFRVSEINELTNAQDWKWVPSKLNVADIATKTKQKIQIYSYWFNGPDYLKKDEVDWPQPTELGDINKSEMQTRFLHMSKYSKLNMNFENFSSWFSLYKSVSYWILYINILKNKLNKINISEKINVIHLDTAKNIIYREVQKSNLADEWIALNTNGHISRSSKLAKMNIYLDDYKVIRVKNRAQYHIHGLQTDFIVLPADHYVTSLIISHYHVAYHHVNHETVLNEIRQKYFIVGLRQLFKSVKRKCQRCIIDNAKPKAPQMAPMPRARLSSFQRPFTYCGIDYFGPILVSVDRKTRKRWGVLITCLTTRAIHIEIAHSLSTDSCLLCLRNFIARRGTPLEIYSDNGTNFRGTEKFLREELKNMDQQLIQKQTAFKGINWKFNPPAAPHMGGAWERLIRSVKIVLYKICPSQKFTDESLRSALMEIEMTINSRPLTFVSLEYADQEAITPNHFLLGSSDGSKPFCDPEKIDYKMNLRQSEKLANMFWHRWVKEMLPTFTRRGKWTQKVKPIEVDDIVLIVDENAERNTWLKGRVIDVIKAKDGQVRRAKIQTCNGILERPAVKLAVLDVGKV